MTCSGLSASGFAYYAESFTLINFKANPINSFNIVLFLLKETASDGIIYLKVFDL